MRKSRILRALLLVLAVSVLGSCGGLPRYKLSFKIKGEIPPGGIVTDLGYSISLDEAKMSTGLVLIWSGWQDQEVPAAEINYPEDHHDVIKTDAIQVFAVLDLASGAELEMGSEPNTIMGEYETVQINPFPASPGPWPWRGYIPGDPITGHSFYITGTATRGGTTYPFSIWVGRGAGRFPVSGSLSVSGETEALITMQVGNWLNGVDFAYLADGTGNVTIRAGSAASFTVDKNIRHKFNNRVSLVGAGGGGGHPGG